MTTHIGPLKTRENATAVAFEPPSTRFFYRRALGDDGVGVRDSDELEISDFTNPLTPAATMSRDDFNARPDAIRGGGGAHYIHIDTARDVSNDTAE